MRVILLLVVACLPVSAALYNIDQPVPISLGHAEYFISGRLWGNGGVMMRFGLGLWDRLTLGISYGGGSVLGAEQPKFYDRYRPDFQARLAILTEKGYAPDLTLGFESQGYDGCSLQVFQVREKGGYVCAGKTVEAIRTYCQLGINYWRGFDAFLALNTALPGSVELMLEYDLAQFNYGDEYRRPGDDPTYLRRRGFLNFGVGWTVAGKVRLALALRDILGNREQTTRNRVLEVSVSDRF
ncbi:hypothetical protein FJY68_10890 [candidate division WOR-3 bacterium]|uniref:Bacterial surface antigen (D15) domain-containing protein n=1 Tax=candidate division WOR-3 bacterium TaxID=2052148 RepID=A0A937XFT4_UNCW3|nr:hypothetical protein [candidate division WOR-3 bacterium]